MRSRWLVFGIALAGAGCAEGPPPLDQLSLREALGARAEVVAALPREARRRLALRLESARTVADSPTATRPPTEARAASEILRAVDEARAAAGRDALIAAAVEEGAVAPFAARDDDDEPLPPVEGAPAGATAGAESRALAGRAGAVVRALLRQSGARRVERVEGWPVAALAHGGTVYVDAAWLVALAALDEDPDAGEPPAAPPPARPAPRAQNVQNVPNVRNVKTVRNVPGPRRSSLPGAGPFPSLRTWAVPPPPAAAEPAAADPAALAAEDTPSTSAADLATSHVVPVSHGSCDDACGTAADGASGCADGCSGCGDGACDSSDSQDNSCDSGNDCSGSDSCGDLGSCNCDAARSAAAPTRRSTRFAWLLLPLFYLRRARRGRP